MTASNSLAIARILAAPWQQRRNTSGRWSIPLLVGLCFVAPLVLLAWSLLPGAPHDSALLRALAGRSALVGVFMLMVVSWMMLVGNVMQQNHPTLARLVPHHAGQLRTALLVAWAMASLVAAAVPGEGFDAPLAWACGTGGVLALLAAGVRWPVLWLSGVAAPFVVNNLTSRYGAAEFEEALYTQWVAHAPSWTVGVVTVGAAILVGLVRHGGSLHQASYDRRATLQNRMARRERGGPALPAGSKQSWLVELTATHRLYGWWLDRLLAKPGSALMSRLLAGLGPATHWTTRFMEGTFFVAVVIAICLLFTCIAGGALRAAVLPWVAYSVLTGVCTNALQAVPRLPQTQREQALLVLLPGVPRGARLNRWLAWQMSVVFAIATACGLALAWGLAAWADALSPGVVDHVTGGMVAAMAAGLVPQVAWQWRSWARMRAASSLNQSVPTLVTVGTGLALLVLQVKTDVGYVAIGVALAAATALYCAWRWWRMAGEPSAMPVGRLG